MLDPINDTYFPLRIIVVLYVLCFGTYIVNYIFKLYVFLATRFSVLILISHRNTSYIPSLAALRWRRKVSLIIGDKSNNKRIRQSFLASLVFMERTRTPQIQRSGCLHLQISTAKFCCVFSICSFRYFFNRT